MLQIRGSRSPITKFQGIRPLSPTRNVVKRTMLKKRPGTFVKTIPGQVYHLGNASSQINKQRLERTYCGQPSQSRQCWRQPPDYPAYHTPLPLCWPYDKYSS